MITRYLDDHINAISFSRSKMAFLSGARQCGKTTLSKSLLSLRGKGGYYNWDDPEFRRVWIRSPQTFFPKIKSDTTPLIILDEIHKNPSWKNTIKGIYDTLSSPTDLLITGSAKLDTFKKGGDSMMGRYHSYRLHPFTIGEIAGFKKTNTGPISPDEFMKILINGDTETTKDSIDATDNLYQYGNFPEPFLNHDSNYQRIWQRGRIEKLIREDLRDLSRIRELTNVENLVLLLPEKIGSLFSRASLREDLNVSFDSIKSWIEYLSSLYYIFEVKPFHKKIKNSLIKEGKIYLWNYAELKDKGPRFENFIASHLLKACHFWTDVGYGDFELMFLRNSDKREIDFLITKDREPFLPIEVKYSELYPVSEFKTYMSQLGCPVGIQIINNPGYYRRYNYDTYVVDVIGADRFLRYL